MIDRSNPPLCDQVGAVSRKNHPVRRPSSLRRDLRRRHDNMELYLLFKETNLGPDTGTIFPSLRSKPFDRTHTCNKRVRGPSKGVYHAYHTYRSLSPRLRCRTFLVPFSCPSLPPSLSLPFRLLSSTGGGTECGEDNGERFLEASSDRSPRSSLGE